MIAPVVLWNARHGWVSLAFQGARGSPGGLKPVQVLVMAFGEVAYLSPWFFAPLLIGLGEAWRKRRDERRLFLLCLVLPPVVFFTVMPLWGARGLPHWTMPGWFFAFALVGAWADGRAVSDRALRRWALVSSGLLAALAAIVVVQASTGSLLPLRPGADPTLEAFDWRELRNASALQQAPAFVLSTKWSDAGKMAVALGPGVPVFVVSDDPRGWAFVESGDRLLGRDGVLIARAADLPLAKAVAAADVGSFGEAEFFSLLRNSAPAVELALVPVHGLTRRLPLPYPGAPGG